MSVLTAIPACYADSYADARARFHAAVDDPSAPDDCAPRESVEVRVALALMLIF